MLSPQTAFTLSLDLSMLGVLALTEALLVVGCWALEECLERKGAQGQLISPHR